VVAAGSDTVAAAATLEDGTSVLLRRDAGGLIEVARSGGPAPSGGTYAAFRLLGVTTSGVVGFRATVSDGPDGLFAATETIARAIAVVGQGSPVGGDFTSIGGGTVHPSGRLTFRAVLSTRQSGVFAADAIGVVTLLRAVALEGDPLPIEGATIRASELDRPVDRRRGPRRVPGPHRRRDDLPRPSGVCSWSGRTASSSVATARRPAGHRHGEPAARSGDRRRRRVLVSTVIAASAGFFVARDGGLAPLAQLGDATDVDAGDSRFRFGSAAVTTAAEEPSSSASDAIFGTDAEAA
jgi:hypothetical protein